MDVDAIIISNIGVAIVCLCLGFITAQALVVMGRIGGRVPSKAP